MVSERTKTHSIPPAPRGRQELESVLRILSQTTSPDQSTEPLTEHNAASARAWGLVCDLWTELPLTLRREFRQALPASQQSNEFYPLVGEIEHLM